MNWYTFIQTGFFLAGILPFLLFTGCLSPVNHLGKTAFLEQRLEIEPTGKEPVTWQTRDVTIQYTTTKTRESFTLSGTLEVSDSVLYTFPSASSFSLYVYLLDPNGVATSKHDITPLFSNYGTFPSKVQFSRTLPLDAGTTAFTFSYWGVFEEGSVFRRARSDSWEIYHNPFAAQ